MNKRKRKKRIERSARNGIETRNPEQQHRVKKKKRKSHGEEVDHARGLGSEIGNVNDENAKKNVKGSVNVNERKRNEKGEIEFGCESFAYMKGLQTT